MEYVFKCSGIDKKYGTFQALKDFNMEIPKGAIYGFVGKNGAGKTTLIRCLCGLQRPTGGSYELMGIPFDDKRINGARERMGGGGGSSCYIQGYVGKVKSYTAVPFIGPPGSFQC